MSAVLSLFGPFVERYSLLSVFLFLLLFSFVLPITEEIALALSGVFIRSVGESFVLAWLLGAAALTMADLVYFSLARYFGPRLLRFQFVQRLIKPERLAQGERYFVRRGPRIIFACRFVVGLRMPGIIGAGFLRMRLRTFLFYDGLASLIESPVWLAVGWALGAQFDKETTFLNRVIAILTPIAVVVGAYLIYRSVRADSALVSDNGEASAGKGEGGCP